MTTRVSALARLTAGLAAALLLASPTAAFAEGENAVTWSVQPSTPQGPDDRPEFDYTVAPGATISDWVAISNFSSRPATFRVHAADATTDYTTAAFTLIGADQASVDAGAWTSVDSAAAVCADTNDAAERACAAGLGVTITLEPGSRADVPFTVTVPHDATPGDHAAGIVASFQSEAVDSTGSAVSVEQRVGTRIYLRVEGALLPKLALTGLVSGYDGSWNPFGGGTGRIGFDVANTGNMRLTATPAVHLTGPFGTDFGTVTLDPVTDVLPGGVAHVEALFADVPPLMLLFADITLAATPASGVAAAQDAAPAVLTESTVAWAVPWSLLGTIAVLGGGTGTWFWWRRRSRQLLGFELAAFAEQIRTEERINRGASAPEHESETVR
ncbi:DUF916 domain-containing protein [Cryobacterium sp. TMT1-3]|uniref:WxL protein peptidoglycan domain-containing protein n=1 Tax=Cryobacterium sp. TMT1-3 TaxID=1259237 RepID=UPI00106BBE80|nr:DUF916 domain-containing protein [Cryobacterium sp. TMT1-3]TFC27365.1 DUF916 domain-containing protein [Cryobacterium sp. TMT1-3]